MASAKKTMAPMRDYEIRAIRNRIEALRVEHQALDAAIVTLSEAFYPDELERRRLKKRKLFVKDQITKLESILIPNLDA